MRTRLAQWVLWSVILLALLAGCSPSLPPLPTTQQTNTTTQTQDYVIGIEDVVEVTVWKNPDLSRVVTVRPDGKISLPLIGDVQAAEYTASQLTERIAEELKSYHKAVPQVSVIVREGAQIIVGGGLA